MGDENLLRTAVRVAARASMPDRVVQRFAALARVTGQFDSPNFRFSWDPHGNYMLEEMPAKGKRKLRVAEMHTSPDILNRMFHNQTSGNAMLFSDVAAPNMGLSKGDTYDHAKDKIEKYLSKGADDYVNLGRDNATKESIREAMKHYFNLKWYEKEVHFLMVTPTDSTPFTASGKDFEVQCKWTEFEAWKPGSTMSRPGDGEPHYTKIESKSPGAARKLYKMLKEDPNLLKSVAWSDLTDWFNKNGIGYDIRFSQW